MKCARKNFLSDQIIARQLRVVGIYRLVVKQGSDNFRQSSVQGIMKRLQAKGIEVIVYEPALQEARFFGSEVLHDPDQLKARSDIIVANRLSGDLEDVADRVFTKDLFGPVLGHRFDQEGRLFPVLRGLETSCVAAMLLSEIIPIIPKFCLAHACLSK